MVTAAWDSSNLVALYRDGVQCETCCSEFVEGEGGNPPLDCCCFLDPDTPAWDGVTTFSAGDLVESGGATYESLQDTNLNHAVGDGDWWEKVSLSVSCGNENWNSYPPFGGPGRTPKYFTVDYIVNWLESESSVTYHSESVEYRSSPNICKWTDNTTEDSNGWPIPIQLDLRAVGPSTEIIVNLTHFQSCNPMQLPTGYYEVDVKSEGIDTCDICGNFECTSDPLDIDENCCVFRGIDGGVDWEGGAITISWYPGQVPEWDSGAGYVIGDIVAWEGVFYRCIKDNVNQEPPNATYWVVI